MAKVLVVDDSPTQVFQFKGMLEGQGYVVVTAGNGRDAIELANAEQPDLVLMDIVMPEMNGFQATRHICRSESTHHIPVIIVSSKAQEADKTWGSRQGAKGYITKPVKGRELLTAIKGVIGV